MAESRYEGFMTRFNTSIANKMKEIEATNKAGSWVVKADIDHALDENASFEIAVIREDNKHGFKSLGWFGSDKLLISHNGFPNRWPLTHKVLEKLLVVATEIAYELNAEESMVNSTSKSLQVLHRCRSCDNNLTDLEYQCSQQKGWPYGLQCEACGRKEFDELVRAIRGVKD